MPRALLLFFATLSLNAAPIAIAQGPIVPDIAYAHGRPVVSAAASGSQFLVAWEDRAWTFRPEYGTLRYRTYDADGTPEQQLPRSMPGKNAPSVDWNGSEWFVTWVSDYGSYQGPATTPDLFGNRLSATGEVLADSLPLSVHTTGSDRSAVLWNGSVHLASSGSHTVIIAADGHVVRELATAYMPLAALDGTFLARTPSNGTASILVLINSAGDVVATVPIAQTTLAAAGHDGVFAVAGRGVTGNLTVTRVKTNGEIVDTVPYPSADALDALTGASMVWSGGAFVVALAHGAPGNRLCLVRTEGSGVTRCISSGFYVRAVSLAANDTKLLVAWSETHFNSVDRVLTAFSPAGTLPTGQSATVATVLPQPQTNPLMIADPNGLSVVWSEPDETPRAMIGGIDRNGAHRTPRVLASPAVAPVGVARGATSTMAVWSTGGSVPEVWEREILDDGTLLPPLFLGVGAEPSVAFDGEDWLIAWRATGVNAQIMTAFVRGRLLIGPVVRVLSPSPHSQMHPVVASRGSDFLVVWEEQSDPWQYNAVLVDRNGFNASPTMPLAGSVYSADALDAAGSGNLYLVGISTFQNTISLAPTSSFPGILVSGTRSLGLRIRAHPGGGFAILTRARFTTINALGDITFDTPVPVLSNDADFREEDGRIEAVYSDGQVFFDVFRPRRRIISQFILRRRLPQDKLTK